MDDPLCPGFRDTFTFPAESAPWDAESLRGLNELTRADGGLAPSFRKGPCKQTPKAPARDPGDAHGHRGCPPSPVTECQQALLPDSRRSGTTNRPERLRERSRRCRQDRESVIRPRRCPGSSEPLSGRNRLMADRAHGRGDRIGHDARATVLSEGRAGVPDGNMAAATSTLFETTRNKNQATGGYNNV